MILKEMLMLINTRLEMVAIFLFIASGCAVQKSVVSSNITPNFESASSVEEVRTQIKKLPSEDIWWNVCLLYTSPSPRDLSTSRMPSSA